MIKYCKIIIVKTTWILKANCSSKCVHCIMTSCNINCTLVIDKMHVFHQQILGAAVFKYLMKFTYLYRIVSLQTPQSCFLAEEYGEGVNSIMKCNHFDKGITVQTDII